jgi:Matrixin
MSRLYVFALLLTLIGSGAYFFTAASALCPAPLAYTLGSFDERFKISRVEAKEAIIEAEALWETTTGRELFSYTDDPTAFPVNFIFDDRQERAIAEEIQRESLDTKEQTSEEIAKQYEVLTNQYDQDEEAYNRLVSAYETRLETFNETVARYNAAGGAPPAEFARLEREEKNLQTKASELEAASRELAALADGINALSEEGNRLIEQYNNGVKTYNRTFGHTDEFTQGDYQGTSINIYTFTDRDELVTVLAHELGHALSIGHVENETSVMYYLMGKQPERLTLSDEDMAAFIEVCGQSDRLLDQIRLMLRVFADQFSN